MNLKVAVASAVIVLNTWAHAADIGGGATVSTGIGLGGCAACSGINDEIKRHTEILRSLVAELEPARQQLRSVNDELAALRGNPAQSQRASTLEAKRADLLRRVDGVNAAIERERREIERLENQLAAAERQAANTKSGGGAKRPTSDQSASGSNNPPRPLRRDVSGTRQDSQFDELQQSVRDVEKGR